MRLLISLNASSSVWRPNRTTGSEYLPMSNSVTFRSAQVRRKGLHLVILHQLVRAWTEIPSVLDALGAALEARVLKGERLRHLGGIAITKHARQVIGLFVLADYAMFLHRLD